MKILYIHGLYGSPMSSTAVWFKSNYQSFTPDGLDLIDYNSTISTLRSIDCDLVIGNSLGGYYANIIAQEKQLPQILINPCYNPGVMLNELSTSLKASGSIKTFGVNSDTGTLMILSNQDELFASYWESLIESSKTFSQIEVINAQHRLTSNDVDSIKPIIDVFVKQVLL